MVAFSPSLPRSPPPIRATASSCRNAITADRAAPERVRSWAAFTGCAFIISAWRCRDRAISSRACRRRPQACIERHSRRLSKRAHKYSNLSPISGWVVRCRHRKKERRAASSSATACGATSNSRPRHLPKSLEQALAALRADACLAAGFGKNFIDYYLRIKEAEIARYQAEVTEWEQREYFELF